MGYRFRVGSNKAAIWTGEGDTAPFDDPLNNLGRVKFHSDLNYINVIDEQTFNVSLPARSNFKDVSHIYPLYAHGRGGIPFVLGKLTVGGEPVAFCGSVPIQMGLKYNNNTISGFARWLSLGADATSVYVYEYAVNEWSNSSFWGEYPAITVPVTVWMTNEILG
jgi:hypothetical protein